MNPRKFNSKSKKPTKSAKDVSKLSNTLKNSECTISNVNFELGNVYICMGYQSNLLWPLLTQKFPSLETKVIYGDYSTNQDSVLSPLQVDPQLTVVVPSENSVLNVARRPSAQHLVIVLCSNTFYQKALKLVGAHVKDIKFSTPSESAIDKVNSEDNILIANLAGLATPQRSIANIRAICNLSRVTLIKFFYLENKSHQAIKKVLSQADRMYCPELLAMWWLFLDSHPEFADYPENGLKLFLTWLYFSSTVFANSRELGFTVRVGKGQKKWYNLNTSKEAMEAFLKI